jgi:sugar lactone lactonase YvrE
MMHDRPLHLLLGVLFAGTFALVGCNQAAPTSPGGGPTPPIVTPGSDIQPTPDPNPSVAPPKTSEGYRLYTVAGIGVRGEPDPGLPALQTKLDSPTGVFQAPDGSIYVADYKAHRIRRVTPEGILENVAGTGNPGGSGDGGPASDADLAKPYAIVAGPDASLVFSEYGFTMNDIPGKVRMIDAQGRIHRVAGGGELDVIDGVPARDARLIGPQGLVYDAQGNLYISEFGGHRVVKVDAQTETITVVAGTGESGNSGDGGPANQAKLASPNWLAFDKQGRLVIVDTDNNNLRLVDLATGLISTLAGTGKATNDPKVYGYFPNPFGDTLLGDGGPATAATLNGPTTVAVDAEGNYLVTDTQNYAIRRIDSQGIITTIAGNWQAPDGAASVAEGAEARQVPLSAPDGVYITQNGDVYFSEYGVGKIRKLKP